MVLGFRTRVVVVVMKIRMVRMIKVMMMLMVRMMVMMIGMVMRRRKRTGKMKMTKPATVKGFNFQSLGLVRLS